jgi:hypothetical protein
LPRALAACNAVRFRTISSGLRTNADDRLPLDPLGRIEWGDGIVEGIPIRISAMPTSWRSSSLARERALLTEFPVDALDLDYAEAIARLSPQDRASVTTMYSGRSIWTQR